ncbi:carboxypeptidase regulatory-like domain-containing protein [Candidatus Uhrbacteria bacterium]|nr:carboxypeptidase regulatory-like domain-containing protein [Candidatus Uhrbacteria bacterium]
MTFRTIGCTTMIRVPAGQESPEFGVQVLDATGAPKDGVQVTFECEDNSAVDAVSNRPSITVKTANGGYGYAKFRARRLDTATFSVRVSAPGEQEHIAEFQQVPLADATDPTPPRAPAAQPRQPMGWPAAMIAIILVVAIVGGVLLKKWMDKPPPSPPIVTTGGGGSGVDEQARMEAQAARQLAEEAKEEGVAREGHLKGYTDEKLRVHDRTSHRRWDVTEYISGE